MLIETYPGRVRDGGDPLRAARPLAPGSTPGRWDYLFSVIKKFRTRGREFLLPERNAVTMTAPFMRAYTELLVRTCHKRGAHAIGGMAAFIPSRRDPEVNEVALEKVRADKTRESGDGFDGSWVAHPDLVPICREVFDGVLGDRPEPARPAARGRQRLRRRPARGAPRPRATITEAGLRNNVDVALRYLAAWLGGSGAVAIHNLMEDAATAEISRSQIWQWIHNDIELADTAPWCTRELVERIIDEELAKIRARAGLRLTPTYAQAAALFKEVALDDDFAEFLTLPAYERMP